MRRNPGSPVRSMGEVAAERVTGFASIVPRFPIASTCPTHPPHGRPQFPASGAPHVVKYWIHIPRGISWECILLLGVLAAPLADARASDDGFALLSANGLRRQVEFFNRMEDEPVVNLVPNASAADWLAARAPRFECADPEVDEIYWFRWWALRKHLRLDAASGRRVFTEFITRSRPVSSALGHHIMEGRWLRDPAICDEYVAYWLRGNKGGPQEHFHKFSQWLAFALWERWKVTGDTRGVVDLLDDLVADYRAWEHEQMRNDGLFWQYDVRDAMEESISGGRTVKNVRPTISSYMYGNATGIAGIARLAGRSDVEEEFSRKASGLREKILATLWNPELTFFGSVDENLHPIRVREAIGFIPWYFAIPAAGQGCESAWSQFADTSGFRAPWGLMTAERRHPAFRSHGVGTCEWDGAVWPFATSQTLTALANVLADGRDAPVTRRDYFDAFVTYTRSQRREGKPYIGEYQDENTGAWLKGADPRSRWYNHSTYADLLISGMLGVRPSEANDLIVAPLLPEGTWAWFCLDGVRVRGRDITVIWDRDGGHYGKGTGLQVWVDGKVVAKVDRLEAVKVSLGGLP